MTAPLTLPSQTAQFGFVMQNNSGKGLPFNTGNGATTTPTPVPATLAPAAGTGALTPCWVKWRDGSVVSPKAENKHEYEGDGSLQAALSYKQAQYGMGKFVSAARPSELARIFAALSGHGSDTYTVGSSPIADKHIITLQDGARKDNYTIQGQFTSAASQFVAVVQDAVCYSVELACNSGAPILIVTSDWYGGNTLIDAGTSPTSVTTGQAFEAAQPFFLTSTIGSWTLPFTSPIGNAAAAVKDLQLKFAQALTPTDFQTEAVTPLPFSMGQITVNGTIKVLWQDGGAAAFTYMGVSGTPTFPLNDTVQQATTVPTGALNVTFVCANDVSVTPNTQRRQFNLAIPNCTFDASELTPKLDGKPLEIDLPITAQRYSAAGSPGAIYTATIQTASTSVTNTVAGEGSYSS